MSELYILSSPVQSGKTTLLQKWIATQSNIGGILTPDVNGKRKLLDITTQQIFDLQLNEGEPGISIGKFVFDSAVMQHARNTLQDAMQQHFDWLVVDEVGKLEMDRKEGLEPILSNLVHHFKTQPTSTKLLLVIRDYLLQDAIRYYGLEDAQLLPSSFFLQQSQTTNLKSNIILGVVLCGGQSVRMGRDKAFITYHEHPQYLHVSEMMKTICDDVVVSCNSNQLSEISQHNKVVLDNATFQNAGPMTGLLSVFECINDSALLVVGCDYPFFTEADMKSLMDAREPGIDVVCYHNRESGFDEPLLAIYEKQCASLLLSFYQNGQTSLQQFLKTVRTKRIVPNDLTHIESKDQ